MKNPDDSPLYPLLPCLMCPVLFGVAEVFLCTTDSGKGVVLIGQATPTLPRHNNAEFRLRWIGLIYLTVCTALTWYFYSFQSLHPLKLHLGKICVQLLKSTEPNTAPWLSCTSDSVLSGGWGGEGPSSTVSWVWFWPCNLRCCYAFKGTGLSVLGTTAAHMKYGDSGPNFGKTGLRMGGL